MKKSRQRNDELHEKLNGSWRAVYSELDGEMTPVAHFSTILVTFKSGRFQIQSDGKVQHAGVYELDTESSPARIIYTYKKSSFYKTEKPRVGIIQLTGDTMKDCLGAIGARPPKSFNTTADSNTVMTVHQRVGSEGGIGLSVSIVADVSEW